MKRNKSLRNCKKGMIPLFFLVPIILVVIVIILIFTGNNDFADPYIFTEQDCVNFDGKRNQYFPEACAVYNLKDLSDCEKSGGWESFKEDARTGSGRVDFCTYNIGETVLLSREMLQ